MNTILLLTRAVKGSRSTWLAGFYDSSVQAKRDLDQLELDKIANLVAIGWPTERARAYVRRRFDWANRTGGYYATPVNYRFRYLGTYEWLSDEPTPF